MYSIHSYSCLLDLPPIVAIIVRCSLLCSRCIAFFTSEFTLVVGGLPPSTLLPSWKRGRVSYRIFR